MEAILKKRQKTWNKSGIKIPNTSYFRAGVGTSACVSDYIMIPGAFNEEEHENAVTNDRFCGGKLTYLNNGNHEETLMGK